MARKEGFLKAIWRQKQILAITYSGALVSSLTTCQWLGPPPSKEVSEGTSSLVLVCLLLIFRFLPNSRTRRNELILILAATFMVSFAAYSYLNRRFVERLNEFEGRPKVVKGYRLNDDIRMDIQNGKYLNWRDALIANEGDAEKVWTPPSVLMVHGTIVVVWSLLVSGLSALVFMFVLAESKV